MQNQLAAMWKRTILRIVSTIRDSTNFSNTLGEPLAVIYL